jgi:hypothetical protein
MTDTLPAVIPASGVDVYRMSTDAAHICRQIVLATAREIQGRKYVQVEGWQAIAVAHACAASSCNVERVDGGFKAVGQVRRMDTGAVIAEAEGFVGEDEATWFGGTIKTKYGEKTLPKRPDFAIRAMAQTRAISRACRSAFAHVVVQIDKNLGTTPAEEMMGVIDHGGDVDGPGSSWGAGGKQSAVDEAERDGLTKNAPKATDAVLARHKAKADKGIEVISMVGHTAESLREFCDRNQKALDAMSKESPADFNRIETAYLDALDAASDRAA